ncbi:MAG: fructosamine kinase family protein [Flavisolibacter sp.]
MLHTSLQLAIQQKLKEHFPSLNGSISFMAVGGGSINQTWRLNFSNLTLFCKVNSASKFLQLFQKEKHGLELIRKQNIVKVPGVIDSFEFEDHQILLLEWIDSGERTENFWKKFGEQLAALHQITNNHFGLDEDNYMGSVPQSNKPSGNWIGFFAEQRLQPLIKMCTDKKLLSVRHQKQFENLYWHLSNIFGKEHKPALVHGDLWSGNFMCNQLSEPVLIDPAVYYGHPSVDMGMTTLFGGFRSAFYEAYHYYSPLPKNYEEQWRVCNLYPLLIHLYLFGSSYLAQIEQSLDRF